MANLVSSIVLAALCCGICVMAVDADDDGCAAGWQEKKWAYFHDETQKGFVNIFNDENAKTPKACMESCRNLKPGESKNKKTHYGDTDYVGQPMLYVDFADYPEREENGEWWSAQTSCFCVWDVKEVKDRDDDHVKTCLVVECPNEWKASSLAFGSVYFNIRHPKAGAEGPNLATCKRACFMRTCTEKSEDQCIEQEDRCIELECKHGIADVSTPERCLAACLNLKEYDSAKFGSINYINYYDGSRNPKSNDYQCSCAGGGDVNIWPAGKGQTVCQLSPVENDMIAEDAALDNGNNDVLDDGDKDFLDNEEEVNLELDDFSQNDDNIEPEEFEKFSDQLMKSLV